MDNFTKFVLMYLSIALIALLVWFIATGPSYKKICVTTCGHVVDKILDGESSSDGEGNHYYTDHRVIVYEDKDKKRYTYEFGEDEREDFYKIKKGEVFCVSHSEK